MPRKLTAGEAKAAFEELVKALPKQHLRLQFRKRFGTGELLDPKMLKRATTIAPREKLVSNLLQEVPAKIHCIRMLGNAEEIEGSEWEATADAQVGQLFSPEEVEQALTVQGRKARLYIYADPTEETVYVLRVVTEPFGEEPPKPKVPVKRTRSQVKRAAAKKAGTRGSGRR
ncbi:hypothetical protein [Fimbriimonas ginsengisoli]|uniref:Uncharacterized protein n=1 Tax=Fimbriimonas ginsengisoli Gsoil 348 TaxID=661478 RepID=A0A068NRK9_FIMGI|nr:hypothetical protein [Fimbriimonas ginsengisoli]AIE85405.1 hypothetical protein OP10G_2037 [Fimbriimonas ginsengisoli Gsoil 348]